jgi:phospholipid transport system substrate-binding protein
MQNRRAFLRLSGIAWLAATHMVYAQPADGRAGAFVKNVGDQLVNVVNSSASRHDKQEQITRIVESYVDVDGVAQFCLGRFWRTATPEQQKRYTELYHQVLVTNIVSKLGEYRGVHYSIGREQQRDGDAVVFTVLERPNNPPADIRWIISNLPSNPKVIDIVAEGTSLRITQRSDYAAYLNHHNNDVDALINAMRQKLAESG